MIYKKIWEKTLNPEEKVEYEFSIGNRYRKICLFTLGIISIGLVIFPPYIVGLLAFLSVVFYYGFYIKIANAYAFTNKRIIIYRGWLSTETISVDYKKITDVTVKEPLLEKFITYSGHLIINTAGTSAPEIILKHIDRPYETKKKLDELRK